jgi:hypothetical protein
MGLVWWLSYGTHMVWWLSYGTHIGPLLPLASGKAVLPPNGSPVCLPNKFSLEALATAVMWGVGIERIEEKERSGGTTVPTGTVYMREVEDRHLGL